METKLKEGQLSLYGKPYHGTINRWLKVPSYEGNSLGYYIIGEFTMRHNIVNRTADIVAEHYGMGGLYVETRTSIFRLGTKASFSGWTRASDRGEPCVEESSLLHTIRDGLLKA